MKTVQRPCRALHLIDVENITGSGTPNVTDLAVRRGEYERLGLVGPLDHLVVASSPYIAVEVGTTWRGARLVVGHGADGADRALEDVVLTEGVACLDQVVIASGDGYFIDIVVALQNFDVPVTVVSRPDALSKRLRLAASRVILLDPTSEPAAAALAVA